MQHASEAHKQRRQILLGSSAQMGVHQLHRCQVDMQRPGQRFKHGAESVVAHVELGLARAIEDEVFPCLDVCTQLLLRLTSIVMTMVRCC